MTLGRFERSISSIASDEGGKQWGNVVDSNDDLDEGEPDSGVGRKVLDGWS